MIKAKLVLATCFALVCSTAYAGSCSTKGLNLSIPDQSRLEQLKDTRSSGLAAALLAQKTSDRQIVAPLYASGLGNPKTIRTGNYKCRTIKMGGISALVAYSFFDCRISDVGDHFFLEKLTGSQRFSGQLFVQDDGVAYKGAAHYGYEEPRVYGSDAKRNQVGCLFDALGKPSSMILELPAPAYESVHDVIELVQQY